MGRTGCSPLQMQIVDRDHNKFILQGYFRHPFSLLSVIYDVDANRGAACTIPLSEPRLVRSAPTLLAPIGPPSS